MVDAKRPERNTTMIKTPRFALIVLTTQPLTFCTRAPRGSSEAPRVVSGPHAPDFSARIAEAPAAHPYLQVRSSLMEPESLERVRGLVAAAEAEGLRPVLLCGQVQGLALQRAFPGVLIFQPAMLAELPGGGRAAPGLSLGDVDPPTASEAEEILGALGYATPVAAA